MRHRYLLFIVFSVVFLVFSSPATAHNYDFDEDTVEYGAIDNQIVIKCHKNHHSCDGDVLHGETLQVCGVDFGMNKNTGPFGGDYVKHVAVVNVPGELPCGLGKHELTLKLHDGTTVSGGYLEVLPRMGSETGRKMTDPHKGDYLFYEIDDYNDGKVRDAMLTNDEDTWGTVAWNDLYPSSPFSGDVFITETDWGGADTHDDFGIYKPPVGAVLKKTSSSVSALGSTSKDIDDDGGVNDDGNGAEDSWTWTPLSPVEKSAIAMGVHNGACDADTTDFDSCSPVHRTGDYRLEGDIIKAYEIDYYLSTTNKRNGASAPKFFICRDGATIDNGNSQVPRVVNVSSGEYYKCDNGFTSFESPSGISSDDDLVNNDWDRVAACDDELDNDGDGDIDHLEDAGCGSSSDNSETATSPPCPEATVGFNSTIWEKVAFYGPDSSGGFTDYRTGCKYNNQDRVPQSGNPPTFYCYKDDSSNSLPDSEMNEFCTSLPDSDFDEHGSNQMLAIEYYIPKHAIPYGPEYASPYGDSDPDWGFNNDQHQSIHDAEEKYDTGDGYTCDSGLCHDKAMWDNERNMTNTGGYASPEDPSAIEDAWIESNATGWGTSGVQNTGNRYSPGSGWVNDSSVWPGGFAGNCPSGQSWKYIDADGNGVKQWQCHGGINTDHEVFLPDMSGSESKAGMFLLPYYFHDYSNRSLQSYYEAGGDAYLESLEAQCWKGGPSTSYSSVSSSSKFSLTINNLPQDPTVPIPVVKDMSHDGTFTCAWNFTDTNGNKVSDIGTLVNLSSSSFKSRVDKSPDWYGGDGYQSNGDKLTGTISSSTLGSVADAWKSALGLSY